MNTAGMDIQEKILMLLRTDPQEAMVLAVERYTGLLWHVAEQHLTNPEDIKECVNDTFMEFYTAREGFDSSKGNLAAYLAAITRNLAVSRYRRENLRRALELDEEMAGDTEQMEQVDRKLDLERAMAVLKPEDMDIIRMKYYGGMTIQEIADSLGLSYETVKKRHQRSLGRMRLALIAVLVMLLALLLAACAYIVIRYLGIVPGYGVISEPNLPFYMLEESVTVENEIGTYVLQEAFVVNGELLAHGTVRFNSEDMETWRPGRPDSTEIAVLQDGDDMYICLTGYNVELPQEIDFEMQVGSIEMPPDGETAWDMAIDWAGVQFPLCLKKSGAEDFRGYAYQMGEKGGIVAIPRLKRGSLLVDLYPLVMEEAYSAEEDFSMVEESSADKWEFVGYYDVKLGEVTAVAPDGRELQGRPGASVKRYLSIWEFGEAQEGEYVIRIPYLLLSFPYSSTMTIPINLETCEWEDIEYEIPGGWVSVERCERVEAEECEMIAIPDDVKEESFSYWKVGIRYRMDEELEEGVDAPQMLSFYGECPIVDHEKFFMESVFLDTQGEDGYKEWVTCIMDGAFDISRYQLVPDREVIVPWNCDFSIPITVEISE